MNRFDNGSVSAYTPQSLQELAFTPLIKRQQHDEISKSLAELNAIVVDPLSEHRDEAVKLKQDLEKKLENLSGELASKGIDGLGKEAFYKLQKERNDLIAPTGRIGQINAAKIAEAEAYKRFLTSDDAKSNSQEVNLANWQKFRNQYKGYDDKNNIINIGDLGAVKYIDEQKILSDAKSDLGMNEKSFKQASSMLNDTGNNNGTRFTVNTSKAGSTGSNYEQVKAMADYFNKRISDPSDPFRKSLDYTGRDLNKVWDQISSHMGMMKKYQQSNESERSYGNVNYYNPETISTGENSDIYGEDYNTSEVGGVNQNFSEIEKVGKGKSNYGIGSSPSVAGSGIGGYSYDNDYKGKVFSSNDIKDPKQKALYDNMFKKLSTTGVIGSDGKKHFIKSEYIKKGKDDPEVAKQVLNMLKQVPAITLTSKLLTKDIELNNSAFSASIGKTADDRDKQIQKQLKLSNSGARKLLDPETGKVISFEEAQKKYDLEDVNTVTYHGYISPLNWEENSFNGTNSKASPHVITVKTKDGTYKEFKTSRLNSDNVGININRYNDLNKNYRNWSINHDEFIDFESDSPSLKGLKVKYNTQDPKIDQNGRVLDIEVLDKNGTPHYMTQSEFVNSVNSTR